MTTRLAVLLSGGGRTLKNLLERAAELDLEVALVISNKRSAFGLQRAADAGIPTCTIPRRGCADTAEFTARIFAACREAQVDWVCLAGFLKHLAPIPEDFRQRVLNVHPALLPAFGGQGFYGARVHAAVLEHGCKLSGCTVHLVDDAYDAGPIVVQRAVEVRDDDTPETLAARVFEAECQAYPEALARVRAGFRVVGRRVEFGPRG
ncbi:MAG: phosphoribosylglycinamide formyltransferase [Planctomycetes bacterium]|nr:phosphoribosylglycinamide formyltransferase [Planctomycetota bacterium]